jgi:hypothetical protein
MKIIVKHMDRNEISGDVEGFTPVAEVLAEGFDNVMDALEYAYRWTNNVMGSWSRTDIEDNGDYNPNVTRLAPLHEGGYGLRSTSMFDRMEVDGVEYEVLGFGFIEKEAV